MSKRYFYTDPLAAAWMAKHHGMEFWHTMIEIIVRAKRQHQEWADTVGNHYIHPNSLHLLEPQIGDLLTGRNRKVFMIFDGSTNPPHARVVERDGIAFMWPESEEI